MRNLDGIWKPYKLNDDWVCRFEVDSVKCNPPRQPYFIGSDRTPLRFYNKKAASIKCEALNRQKELPRH